MNTLRWNGCRLIVADGERIEKFSPEVSIAYHNHKKALGMADRVWYDEVKNLCFSSKQDHYSWNQEYSFFTQPEEFLTMDHKWGSVEKTLEQLGVFGKDVIANEEIVRQDISFFDEIKDKTILIVGAGPSTRNRNWAKLKYDQLWSCNHFFLNPKMMKKEVQLFFTGSEVKIVEDKRMANYMKRYPKAKICLEGSKRTPEYLAKVNKKYPKRVTFAHTRYRSKIGTIPRLIILATLCGAKNIMVVGMDGHPTRRTPHAFEPGKKPKGAPTKPDAPNIFRRQYVLLWDYILNELKSEVEYFNIGEGEPGNLSTDISKQVFPLKRLKADFPQLLRRR